jgi:hypothetical protein
VAAKAPMGLVRESLVNKCIPNDIITAAEAHCRLNDVSMKQHVYPEMLLE